MYKVLLAGLSGSVVMSATLCGNIIDILYALPVSILMGGSSGSLIAYITSFVLPTDVDSYMTYTLLGGGVGFYIATNCDFFYTDSDRD